ncbi:hypothetical protein D9V41_15515 [Aeromicrobium phragmitis]|uniref:Uncharacterized protein n=1 Tax=Aeromicrobium phragmitis TaxID=2478914 RepID=A0A3L8PKP7_9ACTN|nr:hypothetical protein [Aeromicrobium phragmitis]RLV54632.1 hypothetical protein D9V41_15515 [Aeromicrobium phragmitis]
MRIAGLALAVTATLGLAACGTAPEEPPPLPGASVSPNAPEVSLPEGWRWESYRGVQVGVPGDWEWTSGPQRLGQWCVGYDGARPAVGRPGPATEVGCFGEGSPPPDTLVANTGEVVVVEPAAAEAVLDTDSVGDRRVVTVGDVRVIIQTADPALRAQIAATVHAAEVDFAGCPSDHPGARDVSWRPSDAGALPAAADVEYVSACRYIITEGSAPGATLAGSQLLSGEAAQRLVEAMAGAPTGSGPNAPDQCLHGDPAEIIVLYLGTGEGAREVLLRYADCVDNGFDDGTEIRALTKDAATAIFRGPLRPMLWGGHLSEVLADLPSME